MIALPAFNEFESIGPLLEKISHFARNQVPNYFVLLFDDGSSDGTREQFIAVAGTLNLQHFVLGDGHNHGLGYGLREIFSYFLQDDQFDFLVVMDCDDTHDPSQIQKMLSVVNKAKVDVVIASRYQPESQIHGVTRFRKTLSILASMYLRILFPNNRVRDFTCGFRLYSRDFLSNLCNETEGQFFKSDGFSCMPEIVLRGIKMKSRFAEIPMNLRYDRKLSTSKMKFMRNSLAILILGLILRVNLD
jgi:dolichol-phosphate mannosyltransferase